MRRVGVRLGEQSRRGVLIGCRVSVRLAQPLPHDCDPRWLFTKVGRGTWAAAFVLSRSTITHAPQVRIRGRPRLDSCLDRSTLGTAATIAFPASEGAGVLRLAAVQVSGGPNFWSLDFQLHRFRRQVR